MRKLRLLSTAAAVVLIGTAAASAQGMKQEEAPGRAPAAQQNAPAEKVAPAQKTAPALKSERKTSQTTGQGSPDHMNAKPEERNEKSEMKGKAEGSANERNEHNGSSERMGARKGSGHNATTGQGAAAGSAKLSTEQRTKITTIIRGHKVAPAHLNIAVRVGARVPENVHFYPLPAEVVDIYPEWRGYDYILVGDEIVVIDPQTHEIVAVLEA